MKRRSTEESWTFPPVRCSGGYVQGGIFYTRAEREGSGGVLTELHKPKPNCKLSITNLLISVTFGVLSNVYNRLLVVCLC